MKKLLLIILLTGLVGFRADAQRKIFRVPEIPGYVALKCDFHMHSVFSDGAVWPTFRVEEAWRDGLDAIAITDHIEYLPHENYISENHNSSYEIAKSLANRKNIILVRGSEITREMPPGHFNAIFLQDCSKLDKEDFMESIEEAHNQGAFVFWNHPGWTGQQPDGVAKMYDVHRELIERGILNGIEYFNYADCYPKVLDWARKYGLTILANSDVHGSIREEYMPSGRGSRPMTIVYARERSEEALKEALFARRTVLFFNDSIAGDEKLLNKFFKSALDVSKSFYQDGDYCYFEVRNRSDIPFKLIGGEVEGAPKKIDLPPSSSQAVRVKTDSEIAIEYELSNSKTLSGSPPKVSVEFVR